MPAETLIFMLLIFFIGFIFGFIVQKIYTYTPPRAIVSNTTYVGKIKIFSKTEEDLLISNPEFLKSFLSYIESKIYYATARANIVYETDGNTKSLEKIYIEKWELHALSLIANAIKTLIEKSKPQKEKH